MIALEVLPLWLVVAVVLVAPLLVLARLAWGPSPWDNQPRKEKDKTQEQNDQ